MSAVLLVVAEGTNNVRTVWLVWSFSGLGQGRSNRASIATANVDNLTRASQTVWAILLMVAEGTKTARTVWQG